MKSPTMRKETADRSWMGWTVAGIAVIWVSVLAISVFSPELVSGSQQEHLPLAAFMTWIWGLIATIGFLWGMSKLRGDAERRMLWTGLTVAVAIIWVGAVVLSIWLPRWETGSDPTLLPAGAIVAPIAAMLLTFLASVVAGVFAQSPEA